MMFFEYILLEDKSTIDVLINYGIESQLPINHFNLKKPDEHTFGFVKDFQHLISVGLTYDKLFEAFENLGEKKAKSYHNEELLKIIQQKNWFVSEFDRINHTEENSLCSYLNAEQTSINEQAGIHKFAVFGVYPQLLAVAKGDPLKIREAYELPYEEAFTFLCYEKTKNDFESERIRLMNLKRQ